ncbi:hypothetical protein IFM89_020284 [Coptis chinensis]|uniref:DUF506 family protein n=1 Tax=Coptis chinensis TaxID=261450 RepID=A0A835I5Q8_9MAGN|nr:hypothetical protein IFM89_020284 [Coptis chinensis]
MAVFVRSKRVTDPLNDKVKACLCGKDESLDHYISSSSSGSEHDGSPCLSHLVHGFLEEEDNDVHLLQQVQDDFQDSNIVINVSERKEEIEKLLLSNSSFSSSQPGYSFHTTLLSHISLAMDMFLFFKPNKSIFQRRIMTYLRELGYNAGICKTKWDGNGALTSGNYEYIDVIISEQRYIIDVEFAGEFEIARQTIEYQDLFKVLPRVYVGRSEELKQIVKLMCDAAKKSLKSRDLLLPPWRKNRYMQLKWFGSYLRTINPVPSNVSVPPGFEKFSVQCRSVGFDAISDGNGRFIYHAATRIR